MATITELKVASLTQAVNEIKSPMTFLYKMLYGNHETKPTEDIEIGRFTGAREVAPFVRKNGEAIMVSGIGESFSTVSPTNIRIKRPFTPSELLYGRRPGHQIFVSNAKQVTSAVQQHIARDLQFMADKVSNAYEYLCALSLTSVITYSATDQEVFQITYPRESNANITLTTFWNDATPANTRVLKDIHTVKQACADNDVPMPTDGICGSEASSALRELIETGNIKMLYGDNTAVSAGKATFREKFRDDGAIYMGEIGGIDFWEYRRSATVNSVSTPMIRAKYVEFVSRSAAADRVMYFGAIADWDAIDGGLMQTERFSKCWDQKDPSVKQCLIASRPLPVPRLPNAQVSMKVVSG